MNKVYLTLVFYVVSFVWTGFQPLYRRPNPPPPPPSLFLVKIQRIEQMLFCGLSLVETYTHYVILFWYRKPLLGTGTVRLSQSADCGAVTS